MNQLSNINKAITTYFKISEERINNGWCYWWAYVAYKLRGGTLCSTTNGFHAFLKIGDLYFDSDHLQGVIDYQTLVFEYEFAFHSEKEFREHWSMEPIHLKPLLQLARGQTMDQVRLQMMQDLW